MSYGQAAPGSSQQEPKRASQKKKHGIRWTRTYPREKRCKTRLCPAAGQGRGLLATPHFLPLKTRASRDFLEAWGSTSGLEERL